MMHFQAECRHRLKAPDHEVLKLTLLLGSVSQVKDRQHSVFKGKGSVFGARMRKELLDHESTDTEEMTLRDYYLEVHCHRL